MATTTTKNDIDEFLVSKRLALVGASRNPKDFSRMLFAELLRRGYDVVPVNPAATEIDGVHCYPRLQDITPPLSAALVMTPAEKSEQVVHDCAEAGIDHVWLFRAAGVGAVSKAAVDFCHAHGLRLIEGHCPYMFLPKAHWIHRLHGFFLKIFGGYPKLNQAQ